MNKFNRILLASGLTATASLMANLPAFADTTGKVDLSGTVPSTLTITVTPSNNASALTLSPGIYNNIKVAAITDASTNSANGLLVRLSSSWKLTSGSNSIAITKIGEGASSASTPTLAISVNPTPTTVFDAFYTRTSVVAGTVPDSNIFISYTVPSGQAPGDYTGSINFTATDK